MRARNADLSQLGDWLSAVGALGFEHILRVVDKFLIELEAQLHEKDVTLSATPTARCCSR